MVIESLIDFGARLNSPDLDEHEEKYMFVMDVPGFSEDDIHTSFSEDRRTFKLRGSIDVEEIDNDGEKSLTEERFARSVYIPSDVNKDNINLEIDKGVLELNFPKY